MILEPIRDFNRAAFCEEHKDPGGLSVPDVLETARKLEIRAERYYLTAAEKIKALPEVSRILSKIAKKHAARGQKLADSF